VPQRRTVVHQDFVLKSCLVLLGKTVAYDLLTFNKDNCLDIYESWAGIKTALSETINVCNWFGINGLNLTSANALIPIAYFVFHSKGNLRLRGDSQGDARNAGLIRRWLMMSLLNGVFSGSSDSMLHQVREVFKVLSRTYGPEYDFPIREIDIAVERAKRIATSDYRAIERILTNIKYKEPRCFLALTLLFDERGWGTIAHDVDHVFPQELFKSSLRPHKDYKDVFGNLTLLLDSENRAKRSMPFEEWIRTREPAFRLPHLIPEDPKLWQVDTFPQFLEERNRLIQERLRTVLST
jgi:hypothetical protein